MLCAVTADSSRNDLSAVADAVLHDLRTILDALFILVFNMGIEGAAIATIIAQFVGGSIAIIYFSRKCQE